MAMRKSFSRASVPQPAFQESVALVLGVLVELADHLVDHGFFDEVVGDGENLPQGRSTVIVR